MAAFTLQTNHDPNTDGRVRTAIPQRSLNGEAEPHSATEIDYVVDNGANPNDYLEDTDGDGYRRQHICRL